MVIDIQYDFSGQTAIVTGGGRGIGRAVATHSYDLALKSGFGISILSNSTAPTP
jgi:NAD(P)-dependent dehydrogenase (short-subunit alcohol dehydrogenase family)